MNGDLRKKKDSEKDFFKLIKNTVFGKTMEMWENINILNLWQQK